MNSTPSPRVAVIVVAAGSGTRLGLDAPKAFVGLGRHTILRHALDGVLRTGTPIQVVVVAPAGREGAAETDLLEAADAAGVSRDLVRVTTGGTTRQGSVAAGISALLPTVQTVLVHDAARALTPPAVFDRVIEAVERTERGIVPVLAVIDTIKRVDGDLITGVVDRSELAAAQTPQGFERAGLEAAYQAADEEYTDDAALMAEAGHPLGSVEGSALAFKITTPADLDRARALVEDSPLPPLPVSLDQAPRAPRVGVGADVHAFGREGPLWLAGLEWPGEPALSGHSDGDAVAHAIVDALLSAAALGDIGTHFGTDHPEYAGAHAEAFLARTLGLVGEAGWRIGNVAVQVRANRPRLATRRAEAERALSEALGGASVSVSATTTDGLGFTGRGEGVEAVAVALLTPA
ncbi:2-C-methyl-D-erythritol 4-phosphate cytidylyltransferase [Microbacterium sp. BWT-B31]|uniref:2-C-methyl-D-erythritol 4-phosphate cytidylyltransferase n=1 Tax=Microbacterium sp. BWT-B31 TaxID=3232072 RepID=UPI00352754C9